MGHIGFEPGTALFPGQGAQILVALQQQIVQAHESGIVRLHFGADELAAKALLQGVEAGRLAALKLAAHQQFAIQHGMAGEGGGYFGEAR